MSEKKFKKKRENKKKSPTKTYSSDPLSKHLDITYSQEIPTPLSQEEEEKEIKLPEKKIRKTERKELIEDEKLDMMDGLMLAPAPYYPPDMIGQMEDHSSRIFIGDYRNALDDEQLAHNEIGVVIACGAEYKSYRPLDKEIKVICLDWKEEDDQGFRSHLPVTDLEGDIKKIQDAPRQVSITRPNILFFCKFGTNRAPFAATILFMAAKKTDPFTALKMIKKNHPEANPDMAPMRQLFNLYEGINHPWF